MSDSHHYFLAHAREAIGKAQRMPPGLVKRKQRTVARVYHLLAKEAAYVPNHHHIDDFRAARELEKSNRGEIQQQGTPAKRVPSCRNAKPVGKSMTRA